MDTTVYNTPMLIAHRPREGRKTVTLYWTAKNPRKHQLSGKNEDESGNTVRPP